MTHDDDPLRETIAVLRDADILHAHAQGMAALEAGDSLNAEELAQAMHAAGRLPPTAMSRAGPS